MSDGIYNLIVDQGADLYLRIDVSASDGTVVDLTGYSARAQVRETPLSDTILATFNVSGTLNTAGTFNIYLTSKQSMALPAKKGYYDLEIYQGDIVYRLLEGTATVKPNVTR